MHSIALQNDAIDVVFNCFVLLLLTSTKQMNTITKRIHKNAKDKIAFAKSFKLKKESKNKFDFDYNGHIVQIAVYTRISLQKNVKMRRDVSKGSLEEY